MFGNETLDTIYVAIAGVAVVCLLIWMAVWDIRDSKPKCSYMIVYGKRKKTEKDESHFAPIEFAKTEKKAKEQVMVELAGNLEYDSASIYRLSHSGGFIVKIAEFGEQGEKAVVEEKAVGEENA